MFGYRCRLQAPKLPSRPPLGFVIRCLSPVARLRASGEYSSKSRIYCGRVYYCKFIMPCYITAGKITAGYVAGGYITAGYIVAWYMAAE